jgi:hypothetical protein
MRIIGFSTGALAFADFRRGLSLLGQTTARAVELSALRLAELDPLVNALDEIDLHQYEFVSVHAPSGVRAEDERHVVKRLEMVAAYDIPIVVHPDSIHNDSLWYQFSELLQIENMDKRKPIGRTREELSCLFDRFPDAALCLDLAHARQIDPSMTETSLILRDFGSRLAEIHLSEVNDASKHESISYSATLAYQQIAHLVPDHIPIILESILDTDSVVLIEHEMALAENALTSCDVAGFYRMICV